MINYAKSAKIIASIMELLSSAPQCIHQLFQLLSVLTEPGLGHNRNTGKYNWNTQENTIEIQEDTIENTKYTIKNTGIYN